MEDIFWIRGSDIIKFNLKKITLVLLVLNIITVFLYIRDEKIKKQEDRIVINNFIAKANISYELLKKNSDGTYNKQQFVQLMLLFKELDTMRKYGSLTYNNYFLFNDLIFEEIINKDKVEKKDIERLTYLKKDLHSFTTKAITIKEDDIYSLDELILTTFQKEYILEQ